MNRRAVVAEAQRTAAEPRGWKGLVWKRHWHWSHLSSDGRGTVGRFPGCAATGGISMVSPLSKMYVAGSKEEKRAGGRLPGGTIAQVFGFYKGGVAGLGVGGEGKGTEGNGERGAYGGGRPPSGAGLAWRAPLSRPLLPPTFLGTGGVAVPPAGAAPPAPRWGEEEGGLRGGGGGGVGGLRGGGGGARGAECFNEGWFLSLEDAWGTIAEWPGVAATNAPRRHGELSLRCLCSSGCSRVQ